MNTATITASNEMDDERMLRPPATSSFVTHSAFKKKFGLSFFLAGFSDDGFQQLHWNRTTFGTKHYFGRNCVNFRDSLQMMLMMHMSRMNIHAAVILLLLGCATQSTVTKNAFALQSRQHHSYCSNRYRYSSTELKMRTHQNNDDDNNTVVDSSPMSIRSILPQWFSSAILGVVLITSIGMTMVPAAADASYSAYSRREVDWQQRVAEGSIQVSNPKMLRTQLREIAPMNDERSRLFCPNGPSAAVTPLMENRCGDRQATPSVFGRSDDAMGNSIPGFNKEWMSSATSATAAADPGGLPEYGFTSGRKTK
jgi:hypothetical protein